jgi:cob(I)alamin adenosyltransferase
MRKGYIQVYTGDGKGKTTAALGLAIRAAGAGLKVFIGQFIKGRIASEHNALKRFENEIAVKQYGTGFVKEKITEKAKATALRGLNEIKHIIHSGDFDVVILDEINVAIHKGLINVDDVIDILRSKPQGVEIVLTGRNCHQKIVKLANLVTEMKEVRHYYKKGVKARRGIEY